MIPNGNTDALLIRTAALVRYRFWVVGTDFGHGGMDNRQLEHHQPDQAVLRCGVMAWHVAQTVAPEGVQFVTAFWSLVQVSRSKSLLVDR